jgi:hypothetical protein
VGVGSEAEALPRSPLAKWQVWRWRRDSVLWPFSDASTLLKSELFFEKLNWWSLTWTTRNGERARQNSGRSIEWACTQGKSDGLVLQCYSRSSGCCSIPTSRQRWPNATAPSSQQLTVFKIVNHLFNFSKYLINITYIWIHRKAK